MKHTTAKAVWVESYDGHPESMVPVTVYPYRNRVSLNPSYGCPLQCGYCICQADSFGASNQRVVLADADQTMAELDSIREMIPSYTIHLFDHSDPLLPANRGATLKMVRKLAEAGYEQPICITSKVAAPVELIEEIARYQELKLSVFVSLADAGGRVEPFPVMERLELIKRSNEFGLFTSLLMRPICSAWTDPGQFIPILEKLRGSVDSVVLTGLRAPEKVRQALAKRGVWIAKPATDSAVPLVDTALEDELISLFDHYLPGVPISRKRTCAVNRRYQLPCFPPSAKQYVWPKHIRVNEASDQNGCVSLRRDFNGYCRLVHSSKSKERGLTAEQRQTLEMLVLTFEAAPAIPWQVVGGAAKVLKGERALCRDIDIDIAPAAFEQALLRLQDIAHGVQLHDCGDQSTRCNNAFPAMYPPTEVVKSSHTVAIAKVGAVQIDMAANRLWVAPSERVQLGSFLIPLG